MKQIPFNQIKRDDRVRIDYGDIEDFAESIFTEGLIHPICITPDNELIAGGRRSQALDYIRNHHSDMNRLFTVHPDIAEFIESDSLSFGVHFTYKTIASIDKLTELELIENVQRKSMTWQEEVLSITKTHKLKQRHALMNDDTWAQAHTGRLFKMSVGSVNSAIFLAKHLADDDSPLWKCETATDAMNFLVKKKHDEASAALADRIRERAGAMPTNLAAPDIDTEDILTKFNLGSVKSTAGSVTYNPSEEYGDAPGPEQNTDSITEQDLTDAFSVVSPMIHHCDAMEFFKRLGKESVDHVISDPPYGIDMKMLDQAGGQGQKDIDRIAETHGVEDNLNNFPLWLQGCYDILKPKGFCIWFCDAMHFRYLHDLGLEIGFKVQRWPFHWVKSSNCMNQRAEYNFTKSVEHAIVFRKEGGKLIKAQSTNYWVGQNSSEDKAEGVSHPFIKPRLLWDHLLRAVALPGSVVADPFSGVGSMPMAALRMGHSPVTCEIDDNHYSQQLTNMARVYNSIRSGAYEDEIEY